LNFFPRATLLHPINAFSLSMLCEIAYLPPAKIHYITERIWGFPYVRTFYRGKSSVRCVLLCTQDTVIIAFKGTQDWKHWKTDLTCTDYLSIHPKLQGATMHSGFVAAIEAIYVEIIQVLRDEVLAKFNPKKIWLTGHSLGAALAVLFALKYTLGEKINNNILGGVYTYGCPKVGNQTFAEIYNSLLKEKTFRFVNFGDYVTDFPRHGKHVGMLIFCDRKGNFYKDCLFAKGSTRVCEIIGKQRLTIAKSKHHWADVKYHHIYEYIYRINCYVTKKYTIGKAECELPKINPQLHKINTEK